MKKETLTARIVTEYQNRKSKIKTISEFKIIGRELRDRFDLTDREAIDLLNEKHELEILSKHEGKTS